MQRLKTRAQFEAAMAGGTVSRTAHFVLHRAALPEPRTVEPPQVGTQQSLGDRPRGNGERVLFAVRDQAWIGAVVPKRWAKRAVTRNGIKRQVYNVSESFASRLPAAAHVVRLRSDFARATFPSAWSEALKATVRSELRELFARAVVPAQAGIQRVVAASPSVIPAKTGTQEQP